MNIVPVKKLKVVNELVDGVTEAVSLVNFGANEQGFKIVKVNDGYNLSSTESYSSIGEFLMSVKPNHITFDVNVFPDVSTVEKYLMDNNYTDFKIIEKSGTYVAYTDGTDLDFSVGEPVIIEDGITAYLHEQDEPLQEVEKEVATSEESETCQETEPQQEKDEASQDDIPNDEKEPETEEVAVDDTPPSVSVNEETVEVKKFDYWTSHNADLVSFKEGLRAGHDKGLPPSFEYVSELFTKAQIKAIIDGDRELYNKNSDDYLKYMTAMVSVYTDIVDMPSTSLPTEDGMVDTLDTVDKQLEASNGVNETILARLDDLEKSFQTVWKEREALLTELEETKASLKEVQDKASSLESELTEQETSETTIQKRRVSGVREMNERDPLALRQIPVFRMGENGLE